MTVSFSSLILNAHYLGDVVVGVSGPAFSKHPSILEEARVLRDRPGIALVISPGLPSYVDVSLDPGIDGRFTFGSPENSFAVQDSDDGLHIRQLDVVQNDGALKAGARPRTTVEDRCIADDTVHDGYAADPLVLVVQDGASLDIEPDLGITNGDSLKVPSPIPNHLHAGVGSIDRNIPHGELLVSDVQTNISSVDDEVTHESAA